MEGKVDQPKNYNTLFYIVGAVLALAVGVIYITPKLDMSGTWMDHLPMVNACINGTVSMLLLLGFWFITQKKIPAHKFCMTSSLVLSTIFLVIYVAYHVTHESTSFEEAGMIRYIYLFILLTHILFAAVVAPLVLITYVRALSKRFDKHKKLARVTFPIWLYVSITGVVVYIMISPYY
ncbi:MAG: DUF420 domain-containing protein [Flavobacteriales bacterium]